MSLGALGELGWQGRLSPLSYLNMHPHTFTFHNPASHFPQSSEKCFHGFVYSFPPKMLRH